MIEKKVTGAILDAYSIIHIVVHNYNCGQIALTLQVLKI